MATPDLPSPLQRSASTDSLTSILSQAASESSSQLWRDLGVDEEGDDELCRLADVVEREYQHTYRPKAPDTPSIWSLSADSPAAESTPPTSPETSSRHARRGTKRARVEEDGDDPASPCHPQAKRPSLCAALDTANATHGKHIPNLNNPEDNPVIVGPLLGKTHYDILHHAGFCVQWEMLRKQMTGKAVTQILSWQKFLALKGMSNVAGINELNSQRPQHMTEGRDFASAFSREREAKDPYEEADRESAILSSNGHRPVYLTDRTQNWFGGKVNYTIKVTSLADSHATFELQRASLGTSDQFSRRLGSHSIIRLRVGKNDIHTKGRAFHELCLRPFVVGGHVYRAFSCKEHLVRLVMTNEKVEKMPLGDAHLPSYRIIPGKTTTGWCFGVDFLEFMRSFNSLELNSDQTLAKWSVRFNLGLSTSIPAMQVDPARLHHIGDIVSEAHVGEGKPAAELIMTDGCGLANYDFFHQLQEQFEWDRVPSAVQIRVNGSKGLLLQHPQHKVSSTNISIGGEPELWIRASQRKIKYASDVRDPAVFTVDVLRAAYIKYPATLSAETIINLTFNGVDPAVITAMMKTYMQEKVDGLTIWDGSKGIYKLWYNMGREGGVTSARLARERPSHARVQGWVFDDSPDDSLDEEGEDDPAEPEKVKPQPSTAWWPDPVGGSPSSLEETCMALLDSGFHPDHLPVLRTKMKEVAKKANKVTLSKRYLVRVPMSCSAWAVPDPCGVLQAGEIYIQPSFPVHGADGTTKVDIITGDVLITRHPCKVPSDVQRVKAVDRHELHGYKDVVVVSTKGHRVGDQLLHRHVLSMLGGGDYDGDRVQVYWHPGLVNTFRPADPKFATPPESIKQHLQSNSESVKDFLFRVPPTAPRHVQIEQMQRALLAPLKDTASVSRYSQYWSTALFQHGYDSPEAIRLAYLFCAVLDGSKTGITIKTEQKIRDSTIYDLIRKPDWTKPFQSSSTSNASDPVRQPELGTFVMDEIKKSLIAEKDSLDRIIHQRLGIPVPTKLDAHLVQPWRDFQARVEQSRELGYTWMVELSKAMEMGVAAKRDYWDQKVHARDTAKAKDKGKPNTFTSHPITARQDSLRACSQTFHSLVADLRKDGFFQLSDEELLRYLASYAYLYDHEITGHHWSGFPWDVAFRTLCEIKANAVSGGDTKTIVSGFYNHMSIPKKCLDGW